MEKHHIAKTHFGTIIFSSFVASSLLYLYFTSSSSSIDAFSTFNSYYYYTYNFTITTTTTTPSPPTPPHSIHQNDTYFHQEGKPRNTTGIVPHRSEKPDIPKEQHKTDVCKGRYIYMHEIPSKFNIDILQNCTNLLPMKNMCSFIRNDGFGPQITHKGLGFDSESWFNTDQFTLDLIFHKRIKTYQCLTNNSSLANAFFIPFYAGLDAGRFLWNSNTTIRDELSNELIEYVTKLKEWKRMDGRDHFYVAGRIGWDFQRTGNNYSDWGNSLMSPVEMKHITMLTIESTLLKNEVAIPYPTYFHPSKIEQVKTWQKKVETVKRRFLFAFAGAPRPNQSGSIRNELIKQCSAAKKRCSLLSCINFLDAKCQQPQNVIKLFSKAKFCLQPSGDSLTRRSTFDAIISGCIPVFFKLESGPEQYIWHFGRNYSSYSVYIPEEDVQAKKADIRRILARISTKKVAEMRKEVIKMIPRVIYRNVGSQIGSMEMEKDAFDLAVDGILKRVENVKTEFFNGNESGLYF